MDTIASMIQRVVDQVMVLENVIGTTAQGIGTIEIMAGPVKAINTHEASMIDVHNEATVTLIDIIMTIAMMMDLCLNILRHQAFYPILIVHHVEPITNKFYLQATLIVHLMMWDSFVVVFVP